MVPVVVAVVVAVALVVHLVCNTKFGRFKATKAASSPTKKQRCVVCRVTPKPCSLPLAILAMMILPPRSPTVRTQNGSMTMRAAQLMVTLGCASALPHSSMNEAKVADMLDKGQFKGAKGASVVQHLATPGALFV